LSTPVAKHGTLIFRNPRIPWKHYLQHKIDNLAEWAKNPDIQRIFPGVASTLNGGGNTQMNQALKLTNQGWEAKGLNNPF
jgi:hypothetical protein